MNVQKKVNEDDLDWDGDVSTLHGTPYSGIGFLLYPDGSIKREVVYVDGFEEGPCKEFYPNRQLMREWVAERGQVRGAVTEWHENGTVKSTGQYEFGIELKYDEWDCNGVSIASRQIDKDSELMKYVEQMRNAGR